MRCFNEAAARCRGKHDERVGGAGVGAPASMRPRPDAAENRPGRARGGRGQLASMRPRPDAAENVLVVHAERHLGEQLQ